MSPKSGGWQSALHRQASVCVCELASNETPTVQRPKARLPAARAQQLVSVPLLEARP